MNLVLERGIEGTAVLSPDKVYRYRLTRRWAPGGTTVLWIMLNPSVADATTDDATIKKCVGFSRKFEANAIIVVNLFAFRATDPKELLYADDPVGPGNLTVIEEETQKANVAVAAWGSLSNKMWLRAQPALMVVKATSRLKCLGRTKGGAPRHPSRLAYMRTLQPYTV